MGTMDLSRTPIWDSDELTYAQLTDLLQDAEVRLKAKRGAGESFPTKPQPDGSSSSKWFSQTAEKQTADSSISKPNELGIPAPYLTSKRDAVGLDQSRLVSTKIKTLAEAARRVEDPVTVRERAKKNKTATTGSKWFDMPQTIVTPDLKRDLQLLRMRSVIDPKRHYKKESTSKTSLIPAYSQVGVIKEGPTEFFSARVAKRDRKKTFVEEVLAKHELTSTLKRKYDGVQSSKTAGRKAHYQSLKAKRSSGSKNRLEAKSS